MCLSSVSFPSLYMSFLHLPLPSSNGVQFKPWKSLSECSPAFLLYRSSWPLSSAPSFQYLPCLVNLVPGILGLVLGCYMFVGVGEMVPILCMECFFPFFGDAFCNKCTLYIHTHTHTHIGKERSNSISDAGWTKTRWDWKEIWDAVVKHVI